jgi:hypothetical protein
MFLLSAAAIGSLTVDAKAGERVEAVGFVKGYSWGWTGRRGQYAGAEAAESMRKLADTGANYACIAFATQMRDSQSPEFGWADENPRMVSDDEIRRAIDLAGENGMDVILKPVINCRDGTWRAWIRFHRPITDEERAAGITGHVDPWRDEPEFVEGVVSDEKQWDAWWKRYTAFLVHYAKIAEEKQVKVLCLGCEMSSTEELEDQWRKLIAEVRAVYDGALTYDCNHGREDDVAWWDAVDFISVSAYYAVSPPEGTTVEEAAVATTPVSEIVAEFTGVKKQLAALSAKWSKPILFIETGAVSARSSSRYPWSHRLDPREFPTDEQEQANYYQAMFEVFYDEPWFMGFAWWDWPARLYPTEYAPRHRGFCAYGKQAEQVLRGWYAKPRGEAMIDEARP